MKFLFNLILTLTLICNVLHAQPNDTKLKILLTNEVKNFKGIVGVYVKNLKTGKIACINADSLFPTASLIKVPIMCGVFNEIGKGNLNYHQQLTYSDSLYREGDDILGSFKNGEKISLSKVQMLSITTSDNAASLWLQKLAGSQNINNWLQVNGFTHTRINAITPGREAMYTKYGWGVTTPREMATLLEKIRLGKAVNKAASERMYRNLVRIYWDGEALSAIPPYYQVASKQGAVDKSRSEVVLVNAPHGDYVFCIITKNQTDIGYQHGNDGFVLLRKISALLWHYFEPNSQWKPAKGLEKYEE
ncbi:MAG: serine hydrolase [Sphingobacteriales bacterium]|nr:MAG: serine hydrolase [Sphingobacteriales bacterium]TAF80964.1 MAG: serine hydrolase [Sphingobacteriales bacterium]